MSTMIGVTPESIQKEIDQLKEKYEEELKKDSELSIRKEIRLKIKELESRLDSLLKEKHPDLFH